MPVGRAFAASSAGLLARLFVSRALGQIPGLQAQNPQVKEEGELLVRLQRPQSLPVHLSCAAVVANHETEEGEITFK